MGKRHGRRYTEALEKIAAAAGANGAEGLEAAHACRIVKETSAAKFDATVEAHLRLGVDPRHADQMVRGAVALPHGTGKRVRVLVFAGAAQAKEAKDAGADHIGGDDLVKRITDGWTDFDVAIATPDMMSKVGPLGKILGPRGLMPNPKSGTVTFDVGRAVNEVKSGRIEFRTDRFGIVHAPIGKVSFSAEQLHENLSALVEALVRAKPSASKGQYVKTIYLSATMGPSVRIDAREAAKLTTA
ncbi:MAG: 50S ribosomal protein L1 [Candidatus Dormibacteraceae bacterium]